MGLTITPEAPFVEGIRKKVYAEVDFDNNYPTGGEAYTAAQFGLTEVLELEVVNNGTEGYIIVNDRANQKLQLFYGNYDAADGVLIQVPNTTDVSGLDTVRVKAIGY
jgi:hypothetical protein